MLSALLFDLDGTMANTDPIHYRVWQTVMREFGREIDPVFYQARFSGRLNEEIIADLLPWLTQEENNQLADRKEAMFRDSAVTLLQPMPGLLELLDWIDQHGLKRAVVTNAPRANADFMLDVLAVRDRFPLVVLGEELSEGKPAAMPYSTAVAKLEILPEEAIAFEDSHSGVRSAVSAGIYTIGVASTHPPVELTALGASFAIHDFTDRRLLDWLQEMIAPAPAP
ncbi:HAD family phosphatase [Microcoleus sp. FACHB-1515]|nr:HAD family phosphatase [Microcoleus sp. FACHB-1515]